MNTGCSLFHQSEDFMMIRLKPHIPPSSVRSRRALCAPKLEPPSPPFPKKKRKIITQIVSPPNHEGLHVMFVCLSSIYAQHLYPNVWNYAHFLQVKMDSPKRAHVKEKKNEPHHMINDVRRWLRDTRLIVIRAGKNHRSAFQTPIFLFWFPNSV